MSVMSVVSSRHAEEGAIQDLGQEGVGPGASLGDRFRRIWMWAGGRSKTEEQIEGQPEQRANENVPARPVRQEPVREEREDHQPQIREISRHEQARLLQKIDAMIGEDTSCEDTMACWNGFLLVSLAVGIAVAHVFGAPAWAFW